MVTVAKDEDNQESMMDWPNEIEVDTTTLSQLFETKFTCSVLIHESYHVG